MSIVDLRSDTVTLPTEEMREAIYRAELGDDVFGDDPTVNRLEKMAAERMGKEAAMLVPSGTMANLTCVLTHCTRGHEVILGDKSHIFLNEAGGTSAIGGIHPRIIKNQPDGTLKLEDIQAAIRGDNVHWPRTRLICLENTHNFCQGSPLTLEYTNSVAHLAKDANIGFHLDGARIFNAAVALNVEVKELAKGADSVAFCLSKGLSAPVGSLVCGSAEFVAQARRIRKLLGGGMRQAGIIAAAGIVALKDMTDRLREDHQNARQLAEGILKIPGLTIDLDKVHTNIVFFDLESNHITVPDFLSRARQKDVWLLSLWPQRFRAVTHFGITAKDIERVLGVIQEIMTVI